MVAFGAYTFNATSGGVTLRDLFGDNDQLMVYQFMDLGPDALCPGCTQLHQQCHRTGRARRPRHRLGNAVEHADRADRPSEGPARLDRAVLLLARHVVLRRLRCARGGFLLNAFLRDGDEVYRTYTTGSRGVDRLMFVNNIQDLSVYGRQEDWEDSPEGWPQ